MRGLLHGGLSPADAEKSCRDGEGHTVKVFKRFILLLWAAVLFNLLLSMIFPWYRGHVPYQVEGIIMFFALLLTGAYKIAKIYLVGMDREPHLSGTPPNHI
jgi:hypothetical protein